MSEIVIERNVSVPMRDGVQLFADVYRPGIRQQRPVLLQRTAYDKGKGPLSSNMMDPLRAVQSGYVVVIQDTRGRYTSEGEFAPFVSEIDDGFDTVEWCAAQGWSNGRIGMYGISYVGATQWLAAISSPPHLQAIFPALTAADYHDGWIYQGGALYLSFTAAWAAQFLAIPQLDRLRLSPEERRTGEARLMSAIERLRRTLSHLPLSELPLFKQPGLAPYFYDWIAHPDDDAYWQRVSILAHHDRVTVPAFNFGGWYDLFLAGPPRNFAGLRQHAANEQARNGQRLLIGPWTHNSPSIAQAGEMNFGSGATLAMDDLQLRWFDRWLRDADNGIMDEPSVRLYVMGDGWRNEQEWPLARTLYMPYFLHSAGRANSSDGDGSLSREQPGSERPDVYLYNPLNPVGTVGAAGVADQRAAERRTDVLVYSTPPLTEPVEVTGSVALVLYATSSAPDTDFTAKLIDVAPNGYARNLCDGILRTRYRTSQTSAELMQPGQPYELRIDMLMTSNLFQPGHQIRVEVSSSNFPRYDRNPNTGEPAGTAQDFRPAVQTVLHDAEHPSHLLLPVIPRSPR
ncbi:MAG: CocE/NonD family hydrolase [Dehalococcoidia bacterium]